MDGIFWDGLPGGMGGLWCRGVSGAGRGGVGGKRGEGSTRAAATLTFTHTFNPTTPTTHSTRLLPHIRTQVPPKEYKCSHSEAAVALNKAALMCMLYGRFQDAEPMARRALAIDTQAFGPEHEEALGARDMLVSSCAAGGFLVFFRGHTGPCMYFPPIFVSLYIVELVLVQFGGCHHLDA